MLFSPGGPLNILNVFIIYGLYLSSKLALLYRGPLYSVFSKYEGQADDPFKGEWAVILKKKIEGRRDLNGTKKMDR